MGCKLNVVQNRGKNSRQILDSRFRLAGKVKVPGLTSQSGCEQLAQGRYAAAPPPARRSNPRPLGLKSDAGPTGAPLHHPRLVSEKCQMFKNPSAIMHSKITSLLKIQNFTTCCKLQCRSNSIVCVVSRSTLVTLADGEKLWRCGD